MTLGRAKSTLVTKSPFKLVFWSLAVCSQSIFALALDVWRPGRTRSGRRQRRAIGSARSPSRRVSTKRSRSVFGTSPRPGAACLAASSLTYHRHVDSVILMRAGKLRLREARELVGGEAEAASETQVAEARVCALGCRTGTRAPMPSRRGEAGEGQARALGRILASSLPFCWFLLSFRRGRSGHEQKWGLGCRRQDGVFKAANRNS